MTDSTGGGRPVSPRVVPRFSGVPSFLRLPIQTDPSGLDLMICGAPFDGGTTFRPGARFGPRAVRCASALTRGFFPSMQADTFEQIRAADGGDVLCVPMDLSRSLDAIEGRCDELSAAGAVPVFVGGDHSISLGSLRALARRHGPLGLVHFDAHSDVFGPAWGVEVHHGTVFRNALEEGLLRPADVVQVGIRGPFSSADDVRVPRDAGFTVFDMDTVERRFDDVLAHLASLARGGKFFVTFDMDAVDPAFAPGTGTPVPGGLSSYQALRLLRGLAGLNIVGADVVEISPDHDLSGSTALLAATVLSTIAALVAQNKGV